MARKLYQLRYRVGAVLFILALFKQQHLFLISRQSLSAKYSATNFDSPDGDLHPPYWRPDGEDSQFQDELIANRAAWKVLGEGWEGKVFVYKDSVIKTFTPGRSPFRNCVPNATDKWPTEIPASLSFGGASPRGDANTTYNGFLPVKAYFMAPNLPGEPAEWHLVTPLMIGGNLQTLSKCLSPSGTPGSYRDIDALYRPAFNQLLTSMSTIHDAGFCHDNIKPANIFTKVESQWVMGDLGNLREVSHPYHSSRIWRDNGQLEDCRANDVIRVLQSYLKFIQLSMADDNEFNVALLEGHGPMSRLFWWALENAQNMSATELHKRSILEYPGAGRRAELDDWVLKSAPPNTFVSLFSGQSATKLAVDHALMTRMSESSARRWGMVWLFGLPDSTMCGV